MLSEKDMTFCKLKIMKNNNKEIAMKSLCYSWVLYFPELNLDISCKDEVSVQLQLSIKMTNM